MKTNRCSSKRTERIKVRLQPGASKDGVVGVDPDGALRIRVVAPPVEGAANRHLIQFLAKALRLSKSKISIVSGTRSKRKVLEIEGVGAQAAKVLDEWTQRRDA